MRKQRIVKTIKQELTVKSPALTITNIVCTLTFYLAFMIVSIRLFNQDNFIYINIIKDETSEWSKGAI